MKKEFLALFLCTGAVCSVRSREYSLADCFRSGISHDQSLDILEAETDRKKLAEKTALGAFSPEITASGTFRYASAVPEVDLSAINPAIGTVEMGKKANTETAVTVSQVIFSGLSRRYTLRLAENAVDTATLREEFRCDAVRESILQLAYSYMLAQLGIDSLDAGIARLDINRERIQSFYDRGLIPEYDLTDVRTRIQEQKMQRLELESEMNSILIRLSSITGFGDITSVTLPARYLELLPGNSLADAETRLVKNTQLRILSLEQNASELVRRCDTAAFLPVISGSGTFHYADPGLNYTGTGWQSYYTAGISVSLNLWDGGRKINTAASDTVAVSEAQAAYEDGVRSLLRDVRCQLESLRSLDGQLKLGEALLNMKKRQYELVSDLWKKGQKSTLDVLTSEQELTAADARLRNLRVQYLSLYQRILLVLDEPFWKRAG